MGTVFLQIFFQIILILVNAFFAGTEMAVVSLNNAQLRRLDSEGNKQAGRLLKLVGEPSNFLSTIQIGITLAGYLGSALAAENFSGYLVRWIYEDLGIHLISENALNMVAIVLITIILAYFTLVFGELVPKRIAMQKPFEWSCAAYGVVSAIAFVMNPVIRFLAFSTNLVLRILHLKTEASDEMVTEEEIRMMIDIGQETGNIDENEKEWIKNVFDFDDISVRRVMTQRADVVGFDKDTDTAQILDTIKETGLSRYPVYDESLDNIVGILNARDLLLAMADNGNADIMQLLREAYFVPDTIHADTLFSDMQKNKVHIAVIIDEYGAMEGIVTMEDLVEEIVGNIYDEFDPEEEPDIVNQGENMWKVSGNTPINELSDELGVRFDDEGDYDTAAGLVLSLIQEVPVNDRVYDVDAYGLHFHVPASKNHRIETVYIRRL